MSSQSALSGLKVLDLTSLLAAPQIAATLADFGADVVKIEPRQGDPLRRIGVQRDGASPAWALVSRNKRAITLDLDHAEGQRLLRQLVERADVLVENLTPALLDRWQCRFETLAAWSPRLIVVSVSCYGRTGPESDRVGAGALAEAFAGFAHLNGEAQGPPLLPSVPLADMVSGFSGVIGALLACYWRDRREGGSGRGQHVDVSMIEPMLQVLALPIATMDPARTSDRGPARTGSRVEGGVPRNLYRCADASWIALSGTTDGQVARVLEVIGRDDAESRARYASSAARLRVADELDAAVGAWIAERGRPEVLAAFHAARVPVAPVNDLAEVLEEPQVRARGSVSELIDPTLGRVRLVSPAPKLSASPGRHLHTGPALGAQNREVYSEWLGLEEEALERLRRDRII